MAYVPKDNEEEQPGASAGQGGMIGGGRPGVGPSRSKFVNVSEYLSKNPNEGENLVNRATTNLEGQRDEAAGAVSSADTEFGSRVNAGTTKLDDSFLTSALSSPEQFVQNPDNVARFSALKNAAYNGPNSFQETDLFSPTASKVDSLKQTGASIGTEEGRNAIISPLSPKPTAGKTALNQMILQGTPGAAQKLQDVAGTFSSVDDKWNQLLAKSPSMVEGAKAATDTARTTTNQRLGDTVNTFKAGVNQKVDTANADRDAFNSQYQAIMSALNDHSGVGLRADQLSALGLPQDAYPYLTRLNEFNQNLGEWGSPTNLANYTWGGQANSEIPTLEGVAGSEDYAREAALQQLLGSDLGLPDQKTEDYHANGKMPTVDYMGAFGAGGSGLSAADRRNLEAHGVNMDRSIAENKLYGYVPRPGYNDSQDIISASTALGRLHSPDYYTSPSANATPPQLDVVPPPPGTPPGATPPYPNPTSPEPTQGLMHTWDPWLGKWNIIYGV